MLETVPRHLHRLCPVFESTQVQHVCLRPIREMPQLFKPSPEDVEYRHDEAIATEVVPSDICKSYVCPAPVCCDGEGHRDVTASYSAVVLLPVDLGQLGRVVGELENPVPGVVWLRVIVGQ
jgi:hypothetical protein